MLSPFIARPASLTRRHVTDTYTYFGPFIRHRAFDHAAVFNAGRFIWPAADCDSTRTLGAETGRAILGPPEPRQNARQSRCQVR